MDKAKFTPRDLEILSLAFQCLKNPSAFKVDYERLAAVGNFKTAASAQAVFCAVKKKLFSTVPTSTSEPTTPKSTPKKSAQAKVVASGDADAVDDDDGEGVGPPTSAASEKVKTDVTPSTPRSKKRGKIAINPTSDYEEISSGSPKKRARKHVVKRNNVEYEDFVDETDSVKTLEDNGVNFKMEFPDEKPLDLL